MQSSNIAAPAILCVFVAVFAQAAYSLSYENPQRSKRLFWVDKKADASNPDKRLFWVDKKTPEKRLFWVDKKSQEPEKRLFWVDKKSPEKRLFWVDKKDGEAELDYNDYNKIADCMLQVVEQYSAHLKGCTSETEGTLSKSCKDKVDFNRGMANKNCVFDPEGGSS